MGYSRPLDITPPERHGPQPAFAGCWVTTWELQRTHELVRVFAAMLDTRDATGQPGWLDRLAASGLASLAGIATAVREDQHAVAQGVITRYNFGVNEGRSTDLELQKRILAGRVGVSLLRSAASS